MEIAVFNKLKAIADKEVRFTEETALVKTTEVPNLYQKYLDIYIVELRILKDMKTNLAQIYGVKYDYFKHGHTHTWSGKAEIETQIFADAAYHKKRIEANQQEYMVEYLEGVLDNVKRLSFSLKNYIDMKKFQTGMF